MKILNYSIYILTAGLLLVACKDPYMPDLKSSDDKILVVEGFIDGGAQTTIKLSYTRLVSKWDTAAITYPTNATVSVQEKGSQTFFPLTRQAKGVYTGNLMLTAGNEYRIVIKDGIDNYESAYVPLKISPQIDSVTMNVGSDAATIYVNTHDDANNTKFYRWGFDETWEIRSSFTSEYIYDPFLTKVVERTPDQMHIDTCWQYSESKEILITSTEKYIRDLVQDRPLIKIPRKNIKLGVLYSINVHQYALDSLGFQFWSQLKKNTEDVGTIFDPQPNNIRGNITCVNDSSRIVVGYVGAGISSHKRVFFKVDWDYVPKCEGAIMVKNLKDTIDYYFNNGGYIPLRPVIEGNSIKGYEAAEDFCVDCTIRGSNVKPVYWPY